MPPSTDGVAMEWNVYRPGPLGTSCLTCKRRRKKCDRTRPVCETCAFGDHICLGYAHIYQNSPSSNPRISAEPRNEETAGNLDPMQPLYTLCQNPVSSQFTDLPTPAPSPPYNLATSAFGYDGASLLTHLDLVDSLPRSISNNCSDVYDYVVPYESVDSPLSWQDLPNASSDPASLLVSRQPFASNFASSNIPSAWQYPSDYLQLSVFPSPTGLSLVSSDVARVIEFVISQQEQLINLTYFKPSPQQIARSRGLMTLRLQSSGEIRSTMLLGFKILRSLLDGTSTQTFPGYRRWLERFEQKHYSTLEQHRSPVEAQNYFASMLDVAFIRLRLSDHKHMYQLLKNSAGVFLQIAQMEGALQSDTRRPSVSLAGIFAAMKHQIAHFVALDSICSMLYALPPIVEYDTSVPYSGFHPIEWIHGFPMEFQTALVDINALFNHQRVVAELDWGCIEHRIKSWQPPARNHDDQSWKTIARLAVQESWRHTLLVYFYMAIDGASSEDARVQASVRQIFQLIGSIDPAEQSLSNLYCLPQYIVAGACTRSEKQRALARDRLGSPSENKLCLLRGMEFIPVLDHLWHGAAADGRPIWWRDYMHSRQVAYPVSV